LDLIYERDQRENQMIVLNVDKETKLKVLWERITDTNLQIENQEKEFNKKYFNHPKLTRICEINTIFLEK